MLSRSTSTGDKIDAAGSRMTSPPSSTTEEEAPRRRPVACVAELDLGRPLNCMSVACYPSTWLAAVGGVQVLKIVSIGPHGMAEKRHLRLTTKVTNQVNVSINDVEWGVRETTRSFLASAASNGNIVIWDISKDGRTTQERVITAHPRTVNRINWHPQEENLLLSASQDTTVKLWDRRGRGWNCNTTFSPRSESVRDVQFNPHQGCTHLLAAACENGSVHIFDTRKPSTSLFKIMAHNGPVLGLEWHLTDAYLLATGARDRTVKIWNVDEPPREQHAINTVSAVNRIKWRPTYGDQLTTTSPVAGDNTIYLWNVKSPYLPLASLDGHDDVCMSITWLDTPYRAPEAPPSPTSGERKGGRRWSGWSMSLSGWGSESGGKDDEEYTDSLGVWQHLLSCGRDGRIILHSLARATRPLDAVTPSVIALSARGEIAAAYEHVEKDPRVTVGLVLDERTANAPGIFAEGPSPEPPEPQPNLSRTSSLELTDRPRSFPNQSHTVSFAPRASSFRGTPQAVTPTSATAVTSTTPIDASGRASTSSATVTPDLSPGGSLRDGRPGPLFLPSRAPDDPSQAMGWIPRHIYRFSWDGDCEGLAAGGDVDGPALYAELIGRLASAYRLHPDIAPMHPSTAQPALAPPPSQLPSHIAPADDTAFMLPATTDATYAKESLCAPAAECHLTREKLCRHNAAVARANGLCRAGHVWELLAVLLPCTTPDDRLPPRSPRIARHRRGQSSRSRKDDKPPQAHRQQPSERPEAEAMLAATVGLDLLRRPIVTSLVEDLLDQGDVQLAVAICEVLASTAGAIKGEQLTDILDIDNTRLRECHLGYIEILHRLELYQAANELVSGPGMPSEDKFIQQLHVTNTSIYASCASCRRPLGHAPSASLDASGGSSTPSSLSWCSKCRSMVSQCAICQQPVRGVYVWCPGCSHGGHLEHMREWFLVHGRDACPTGCGHMCANLLRDGEKTGHCRWIASQKRHTKKDLQSSRGGK